MGESCMTVMGPITDATRLLCRLRPTLRPALTPPHIVAGQPAHGTGPRLSREARWWWVVVGSGGGWWWVVAGGGGG